jgi:crossover junction endodeoxyribonuclease RuvC
MSASPVRRRKVKRVPAFRVLGVDASLNGTAICFPDGQAHVLTLNTNKSNKVKGPERLAHIKIWLDTFDFSTITHVCWENYAFSKTGMVFHIGELGGLIKLYFLNKGIPVLAVPPTSLKKYVTGKGNAKKHEMQSAILADYGFDFKDDNEADAFGLMKFGYMWVKSANSQEISVDNDALLSKVEYYGTSKKLQTFAIL